MGITNMQSSVRTIALAIREEQESSAQVKRINTGSYIYTIMAIYCPIYGLRFEVNKRDKHGKIMGDNLIITRFSTHGMDYDNTVIGSLPDSVVKAIRMFLVMLYRKGIIQICLN